MMLGNIISTIGLSIDILGVVLIFVYAPLQPDHEGGFAIEIEDGTPMPDGRTALEHREEKEITRNKYDRRSKLGLLLLIVGFFIQIVGNWI